MKMNATCPVCESPRVEEFLRRDSVPVHQNLLLRTPDAARKLTVGQLSMMACLDCSFVFNRSFNPNLLSYGEDYDNSQNLSAAFERHLNVLVHRLVEQNGVSNCTIVEVGCGKGDFLNRLTSPVEYRNRGYGFDPAYVGADVVNGGRTQFFRTFYSEASSRISADVVISRHVIEHVPEPRKLLKSIRAAWVTSPNARVFFETPCVEWILKNQVVWDLFYEHCSLFTASSLTQLFEATGFEVNAVDHVFGGQYLWLEARIANDSLQKLPKVHDPSRIKSSHKIYDMGRLYGQNEEGRNQYWTQQIQRFGEAGRISLWGAGAKGVTFANLIDKDKTLIHCVVESNPKKQGKFLAGTGHPIISPKDLQKNKIRSVVVLNPNYTNEIRGALEAMGAKINLIDLMQTDGVPAA